MRITRHTAPDMRQALRLVRDRLGADAVILSTRHTAQGVEVTAAMDFDADSIAPTEETDAAQAPIDTPAAAQPAAPPPAAHAAVPPAAAIPTVAPAADTATADELRHLRHLLETRLSSLAWRDLEQRSPVQAQVLRELTQMGLDPDCAHAVAGQIPPGADLQQARRLAITGLAQRVPVTGQDLLDHGGRIALVGPTGVGKTTTLAKLAVRWVLRHGSRDLALVGTDTARLGAREQLRALGQLLGVPVHTPASLAELPALLGRLERCGCVLVDTAGQGQRDAQLAQRLQTIAGSHPDLATLLVLAASTQAGAVAETVGRFAPARPAGVVLTKLDEATSLGGLLSVLMRTGLPASHVSDGQRVPEDLRPARALELVSNAVQLARASGATADEDLLQRRFGDLPHALAS